MNRSKFVAPSLMVGGVVVMATTFVSDWSSISSVIASNINVLTAVKWSSIAAVIGGAIYFIASKNLLHLKVIEVGEMGFRTKYGKPMSYRRGNRRGQHVVYYPGDRVIIIPVVHDIVVVSNRLQVGVAHCQGVYAGKNIHFDIQIEWQILADAHSAFLAAFSLHDAVRDDESTPTLSSLMANRTVRVVDAVLASLPSDSSGLPLFNSLDLYSNTALGRNGSPLLLETLEEHGAIVNSVQPYNRTFAPEERQKEGLTQAFAGRST